jgi:mannose-6-phosphate isomerase-like protein (cupin superfamily)
MTFARSTALLLLLSALPALAQAPEGAAPAGRGGRGAAAPPMIVWAPKPLLAPFVAPNKPLVKVADLQRRHARDKNWNELVVRDATGLTARYIQMAPGEKTKTQFYVDSSMFWFVQAGQMRVTIQGQEPFVAGKGFVVQVPAKVQYAMETVGDAPVLRFEVTHTRAQPFYPVSETPTPVKGYKYEKVSLPSAPGTYGTTKPFIDYQKEVIEGGGRATNIRDGETAANINRAPGAPTPPPTQWGHFHDGTSEFWFMLDGNAEFLIEGVPLVKAEQGDVVYAPAGRWHRSGHVGTIATRVSIHPIATAANSMQADGAGGGGE